MLVVCVIVGMSFSLFVFRPHEIQQWAYINLSDKLYCTLQSWQIQTITILADMHSLCKKIDLCITHTPKLQIFIQLCAP